MQCERWQTNKISSPDISYMEVQLDTLKALKKEAVSLATRVDWTESSFGVSQLDLDQTIIDLSQNLQEARRSERQNESKTKKISDQISSRGPALSLPKILTPTDILPWVKMYKQIKIHVTSDICKLALIKQSLTGKDKRSTDHLDSIGGVLSYIHEKYAKGDIVLNILTKQAYDLHEPWTAQNSLKNIETFLVIISHFFEWKLQRHLNSKFRDEMLPLLFCKDTRWRFIEAMQQFETTLHPPDSSSSPLALCSSLEKSEDKELQTFSLKLESAANPEDETKRLEFWISCVKKFSEQLRAISLYSDEKKNNSSSHKNSFFESPHTPPHQNRQGGANLKLRCFTCPNFHMTQRGRPSQYLALCPSFRDQALHKQKELLKTHKMCQICLGPKSSCSVD